MLLPKNTRRGATDEVKEGPNYVQVTDNRGTEAGWSLKVKQEGQFKSTSGKELTGALSRLKRKCSDCRFRQTNRPSHNHAKFRW